MSIHSGYSSLGSGSRTVEVTTTLYDLIEAIGDSFSKAPGIKLPESDQKRIDPARDRLIARKIAGMFLSGRVKFKHPRDVRNKFPEWFD